MANPPVNPKQFKGHEQHLSALENQHRVEFTRQGLNYTGGFTPKPSYNRCNKCELKDTCNLKMDKPEVQIIIL